MSDMQSTSAVLIEEQSGADTAVEQNSPTNSEVITERAVLADQTGPAVDGAELLVDPEAGEPSVEQSSTKTKTPRSKSKPGQEEQGASICQMIKVELGEIYDEHSLVAEVRQESGITFRDLPVGAITKSGLLDLASHSPLHVVKNAEKFYCIGGLRFFRLLKYDLPASTRLPVIVHEGLNTKKLRSRIYFDLYLMPLIAGIDVHDRKRLSQLSKSSLWMKLFSLAFDSGDGKGLAKLLGCDPRTLGKVDRETGSSETKQTASGAA